MQKKLIHLLISLKDLTNDGVLKRFSGIRQVVSSIAADLIQSILRSIIQFMGHRLEFSSTVISFVTDAEVMDDAVTIPLLNTFHTQLLLFRTDSYSFLKAMRWRVTSWLDTATIHYYAGYHGIHIFMKFMQVFRFEVHEFIAIFERIKLVFPDVLKIILVFSSLIKFSFDDGKWSFQMIG